MTTVTIDVDVDLDDFDDEDIREEYESRGLGDTPGSIDSVDDIAKIEAIYHLMRMKKSKQAYRLMYDYVRDRLGKAV